GAPRLAAIIIERRSLADAILTGHQQPRSPIDNGDCNYVVFLVWPNPPYAHSVARLIAQLLLMKAQAHSFFRDQDDLVIPVGKLGIDQAIAFLGLNCDNASFANVGVIRKIRFLNDPRTRRENNVEIFVPRLIDSTWPSARFLGLNSDRCRYFLVGAQLKDISDGSALCRASHFGNFIDFFNISTSGLCEKHQIVMRRSGEEMLDKIAFVFFGSAFTRGHADHTFAAPALRSKCT